jgi:hypothetical protein
VNVLKAKDKLRKMLFDFKTHTGIRGWIKRSWRSDWGKAVSTNPAKKVFKKDNEWYST